MNRFSRDASRNTSSNAPFPAAQGASSEAPSRVARADTSPDEARRLLEEVQRLGSRMRNNRRRAQQIDRRAAAYASRLARHTARLLQHMPNAVPAVRPVPGTGASALRHYVLKHDTLESPQRTRLLVVSSDGRLRVCTVVMYGHSARLWTDYEVANPPVGLGLSVVFEGLSSLIVKLESAVVETEQQSADHEQSVDGMIAESEARLAFAGSRLAPIDAMAEESDAADTDVYGETHGGELKSHGFEQRISFGGARTTSSAAPAVAPTAPARAPGRFQR